jgi:hypothetical protein
MKVKPEIKQPPLFEQKQSGKDLTLSIFKSKSNTKPAQYSNRSLEIGQTTFQ